MRYCYFLGTCLVIISVLRELCFVPEKCKMNFKIGHLKIAVKTEVRVLLY